MPGALDLGDTATGDGVRTAARDRVHTPTSITHTWPPVGQNDSLVMPWTEARADSVEPTEDAMDAGLVKALVHQVLVHSETYPWMMQDIGLLGLRLDDRREYRLHIWDPSSCAGEPPVHDHPFDFVSQIIVGEMVNTRYTEDPEGFEYNRIRYSTSNEDVRGASDTVTLSGTPTTYTEGGRYSQGAHELHDSRQLPGTATIIRMAFKDVSELTVCRREDATWVSGRSRPATAEEVKRFTTKALAWF